MKSTVSALTVLLVAALLMSVAHPLLAQDAPERTGLRVDAPQYGVRGPHWVGYKSLVMGQGTDREMEIDLWYPALNPEGADEKVEYEFTLNTPDWRPDGPTVTYGRALMDAPIDRSSGPYPLVVFSHAFGINPEWYPTTLEHFASHGFIVLAPEHVEQFDWDWSAIPPATIDRPRDIRQTLDYAEELTASDGDLAGLIDMENVAVVGHSYGGYAALAIAGAQYDFEAFTDRCETVSEDDPDLFQSICAPLFGKEEFLAERAGLDGVPEGLWPSMGDPRVTAIVPISGDSYLFDRAGLAKVKVPMMVIGATADTMVPYDWGSKPAYEYASSEKKALLTFEGAEHTFMMGHSADMPWLINTPFYGYADIDPVWDRDRSLDLTHHFVTAFLLDTLKNDAVAAAALAPEAVSFAGIEYQAQGYGPAVAATEPSPVTKRSALAAVNDIILYYEVMGEGEPLLLITGGTGCTDGWGSQRERLAQNYMVISPDSRAQGRSTDSGEPLTYQLMADDMVALLDRLNIESAHVVGRNDGGNVGLDMAIRYPERVRSLVATGAQFRADGMIPDEMEWAEELSVDSFPQEWLDFCYRSIASDPEQLPAMIEQIKNLWLTEEYVPYEGLTKIAAPVLILEGTVPDFLQTEHVEALASAIPGAELQWIEGTGHFAPADKPDEWCDCIEAFISRVEEERTAVAPVLVVGQ